MMHVVKIELNNWMRYRGKQEIELESLIYGVTAKHDSNSERSNWLGKSSFLQVIPFVLFGALMRGQREDSWISKGQDKGMVAITLSDGTRISRTRTRGKSTQLVVEFASGEKFGQSDAQARIVEIIGMSKEDFFASCFIRQKQMSEFITCEPSARFEKFSAWMKLEKLQAATQKVKREVANTLKTRGEGCVAIASTNEVIDGIVEKYFEVDPGETRETITKCFEALLQEKTDATSQAQEELVSMKDRLAVLNKIQVVKDARESLKAFELKLAHASEQLAKITGDAPTEDRSSVDELAKKQAEMFVVVENHNKRIKELEQIKAGKFGGKCPLDGHACSDVEKINCATAEAMKLIEGIESERAVAREKLKRIDDTYLMFQNRQKQIEFLENAKRNLESRCDEYRKTIEENKGVDEINSLDIERDYAAKLKEHSTRLAEERVCASDFEQYKRFVAKAEALRTQEIALGTKLSILMQASNVMDKTQKAIAERVRSSIELGANELLEASGVDLRLQVLWDKEGTGVAATCNSCGNPFPKSKAITVCTMCGSERGANKIEKLHVELSDRSGAAEDLAGIAIQLAAAAWLRNERNSQWSVAFIDEPFGALDRHNRRGLSGHLNALLKGGYSFDQAFIVAHEQGITDNLQGRVLIQADEERSVVAVE